MKGGRDSDDVWSKMSGPQLDVASRFQPNKSKRGLAPSKHSPKQTLGTGGPRAQTEKDPVDPRFSIFADGKTPTLREWRLAVVEAPVKSQIYR